jgi:hypothetical protein
MGGVEERKESRKDGLPNAGRAQRMAGLMGKARIWTHGWQCLSSGGRKPGVTNLDFEDVSG